MKKNIQIITVIAFAFACTTSYAGILENKVVQLLSQSILNNDISGSEKFYIGVNLKQTIAKTGEKAVSENASAVSDLMITNDTAQKLTKIEGNTKIVSTGISMSLPINIILQENTQGKQYMYMYIFPEYSQLLRQFSGADTLNAYDNTWQRVDVSELDKQSTSTISTATTRKDIRAIWNDTSWFTAKSKKSGGVTTYTIKVNPAVLSARLNKSLELSEKVNDPTRAKKQAEMIALLKKLTFQVTEKNNKLDSYYVAFSAKDNKTTSTYSDVTNKKVNTAIVSTVGFTFKGSPQAQETIVIPTQYQIFSLDKLIAAQKSATLQGYDVVQPMYAPSDTLKGDGFTYIVPAGYFSQKRTDGYLYVWKSDQDSLDSGVTVISRPDNNTKADLVKMNTDADANKFFKEWEGAGFQKGYIRVINGQTYYIKEQFLPANINKNGDINPEKFQLNSLMALTYKGDKVYIIEFTDDYVSYDRNKAFLETFLSTFKIE